MAGGRYSMVRETSLASVKICDGDSLRRTVAAGLSVSRRRWFPLLLCLAFVGCFPTVCGEGPTMGQFGAYPSQPAVLRTPAGQEIPVYRIKYWRFDKGAPALQLEYESPVPLSDTAAVRAVAHSVWPVFVAYVDSAGLSDAILTATTLERRRVGWLRTSRAASFGILAH